MIDTCHDAAYLPACESLAYQTLQVHSLALITLPKLRTILQTRYRNISFQAGVLTLCDKSSICMRCLYNKVKVSSVENSSVMLSLYVK